MLYVSKLTNNLFSVHAANSTGNTYHSDPKTAEFRIRTGRSLVLGYPWVGSISLTEKCNSYQLRMLQLPKSQYIVPLKLICGTID